MSLEEPESHENSLDSLLAASEESDNDSQHSQSHASELQKKLDDQIYGGSQRVN